MLNHRKGKKKKSLRLVLNKVQTIRDQQQIATQNLFNASNFFESTHPIDQNDEIKIFDSVNLTQENQNTKNIIKYNKNTKQNTKCFQFQNLMDKQFIQQSRMLLKLYSTMTDQNSTKTASKLNKQKTENYQNLIKKQNSGITCSAFKSDSVFVAKTKYSGQSSLYRQKKRLQQILSPQNKKQNKRKQLSVQKPRQNNRLQSMTYYTPHKNYFNGTLNNRNKHNRSLSPQFEKNNAAFPQYGRIRRLKTLNPTNLLQIWKQQSLERDNSRNSQKTQPPPSPEQGKNATFRRRHTFYKAQHNKLSSRINQVVL